MISKAEKLRSYGGKTLYFLKTCLIVMLRLFINTEVLSQSLYVRSMILYLQTASQSNESGMSFLSQTHILTTFYPLLTVCASTYLTLIPLFAFHLLLEPCTSPSSPPINKMVYALWETGKALIIPSHLLSEVPRIHYNPVHWTISKGKPEGRLLIDPSDSAQTTPLNCESVRLWTDEHVGRILHPTLTDYAHMILRFIDTLLADNPLWTLVDLIPRLRLFKMDLKGAFTLLNYHPDDAGLMSSALTDGLTLVSIVAGFGHTQTPAQFNHITRVLERVTQPLLHGLMLMYVDDVNGITLDTHLAEDLATVRDTATRLLGPTAINDKKTETGLALTFIGYSFDLTRQIVSIGEHTFQRATFAFFSTDTTVGQSVTHLQRLASYSSRMDEIVPLMRPFSASLHHSIRGKLGNIHVHIKLSAMAIRAIYYLRPFHLYSHPHLFCPASAA